MTIPDKHVSFANTLILPEMDIQKIYKMPFANHYPQYVRKVETKGRSKAELDEIICWLTGYDQKGLQKQLDLKNDFETFFRHHI